MKNKKILILVFILLVIFTASAAFAFWRSQQAPFYPQSGGSIGGPNNCKPGYPCVMEEDEGKKKVSDTPEVRALVEKYGGWEHVHIQALDIELVKHTAFIEKIYPHLASDTGCIIIVHAGEEGYVYRQDKKLNISYQETLPEFLERTKNIDSQFMSKFYLSMH